MISRVLLILALLTGGAFAQGPILPGPGLPVAAAGGFSLVYSGSANSTSTTTTVDYTVTIGTNNRVVVGIGTFAAGPAITSVTALTGSVAFTQVVTDSPNGNVVAWIWESNSSVATGSQVIRVVYTVAPLSNSVLAAYGLQTTTPAASNTSSATSNGATSINNNITVPTGGGSVSFGIAYQQDVTFTGSTSDATINNGGASGDIRANTGHTTTTGSVNVAENVASSTVLSLVLASWGP